MIEKLTEADFDQMFSLRSGVFRRMNGGIIMASGNS